MATLVSFLAGGALAVGIPALAGMLAMALREGIR